MHQEQMSGERETRMDDRPGEPGSGARGCGGSGHCTVEVVDIHQCHAGDDSVEGDAIPPFRRARIRADIVDPIAAGGARDLKKCR